MRRDPTSEIRAKLAEARRKRTEALAKPERTRQEDYAIDLLETDIRLLEEDLKDALRANAERLP